MMEDTRIIEMFFERDQQAIQELDTKYGKVISHVHNLLCVHVCVIYT